MAGGHGGRRAGSGRRKGSAHRKTREVADKVTASGETPLEISIAVMRELWSRAKTKTGKLNLAQAKQAHAIAKDVAPYCHPKLQAIVGDPEKPVVHEHRMDDLQLARAVAFILQRASGGQKPAIEHVPGKKMPA